MPHLTPDKLVVLAPVCPGSGETSKTDKDATPTTVAVNNLPRCLDLRLFLEEIKSTGFGSAWNFANMPEDRTGGKNRGYAFLNLHNHNLAVEFMNVMNGHLWDTQTHDEIATPVFQPSTASWAKVQGLEANTANLETPTHQKPKKKNRKWFFIGNGGH